MSIKKIYLRHFKHFSLNSIFWEDFQDSEEIEMSTDYKIGNLISNNLRASQVSCCLSLFVDVGELF